MCRPRMLTRVVIARTPHPSATRRRGAHLGL
jgi:hypothetical protein